MIGSQDVNVSGSNNGESYELPQMMFAFDTISFDNMTFPREQEKWEETKWKSLSIRMKGKFRDNFIEITKNSSRYDFLSQGIQEWPK